jgi:hypothetical protein
MALKHEGLTGQIIKAFYKVYNELGFGFLEKVYENAWPLSWSPWACESDGSRQSRSTTLAGRLATTMQTL